MLALLDASVAGLQPRWLFLAISAGSILILVFIAIASVVAPNSARFSIEAATEIVRVELPPGRSSFDWGDVPVDPASVEELPAGCTDPILDLTQPLDGPVDMVAKLNPTSKLLSVTLTSPTGANLGSVSCGDGRVMNAGRFVRLAWPSKPERHVTLRFFGHVAVGDTPAAESSDPLLLREGTITTEAIGWPGHDVSISRQSKLYAGDSVRLYAEDPRQRQTSDQRQALSHGLLQIEQGAISVIAHANAREARVIRVGQESETATSIAPSFWDRLQAQSAWALLIALGAISLNVLNALRSYRQELLDAGRRRVPDPAEE